MFSYNGLNRPESTIKRMFRRVRQVAACTHIFVTHHIILISNIFQSTVHILILNKCKYHFTSNCRPTYNSASVICIQLVQFPLQLSKESHPSLQNPVPDIQKGSHPEQLGEEN